MTDPRSDMSEMAKIVSEGVVKLLNKELENKLVQPIGPALVVGRNATITLLLNDRGSELMGLSPSVIDRVLRIAQLYSIQMKQHIRPVVVEVILPSEEGGNIEVKVYIVIKRG